MKSLAVKLSILVVFLVVSGCAFATNGEWSYIRIGTTNQGLEVRDGDKSVKVDSQKIDAESLRAIMQAIGAL